MLRRKNNQLNYVPQRQDQSPYRFQRKNNNVSPGLSPMRSRTPTRTSNLSPFRGAPVNDHTRPHSPIKFVSHRPNNPQINGFFRNDTQYQNSNCIQKYATVKTNSHIKNDMSSKRQTYQQYDTGSRLKAHQQGSQRPGTHENTKLFSKLVERINYQKNKQPQLIKKNTKSQIYRQGQKKHVQQIKNQEPQLTKHKSQPGNAHELGLTTNIQSVESVNYEKNQNLYVFKKQEVRTYKEQQKTCYKINDKNKHVQYISTNKNQVEYISTTQNRSPLRSNNRQLLQQKTNQKPNYQKVKQKDQAGFNSSNKKPEHQQKQNKQKQNIISYAQQKKIVSKQKQIKRETDKHTMKVNNNDFNKQAEFDDVKFYLDMLRQSKAYGLEYKEDNNFRKNNNKCQVNMSLMNMDPFI